MSDRKQPFGPRLVSADSMHDGPLRVAVVGQPVHDPLRLLERQAVEVAEPPVPVDERELRLDAEPQPFRIAGQAGTSSAAAAVRSARSSSSRAPSRRRSSRSSPPIG